MKRVTHIMVIANFNLWSFAYFMLILSIICNDGYFVSFRGRGILKCTQKGISVNSLK